MSESVKRGLAAVMFTDMVGYTALMQVDEQQALLNRDRHRAVLEETHHKFQGDIIQYFGDGTLSVFDSVVEAVRCAMAIQLALQQEPKVPLRIGIHMGDIVYSDSDIIGDGVNIAARLESFAVPGSILISSKVLDDIQNQTDILTQSMGIFELKNVNKPVEIFAIANEGLVIPRVEDMAGKGNLAKTTKHNLPAQLTSFIGREQEIEEIISLLLHNRLVTLTGPGGTGKTRLSISVAEGLLGRFPDGVYFVALAPIREANMLAFTIAKVLGVEENPMKTVLESLKDYLQSKNILLVLDNFEQIIDAASDVFELLQSCSDLKILVSSRIVLRIGGEQEYSVQPLLLPDRYHVIDTEEIQEFPSIRLFVQRAKAVKSSFELTSQNANEIAQICNRLDGLPLAIELAAARIRLFSPKSLLEKLSKSLDILKIKERNRPSRHQTLRQTIGWSYELLSAEEQILFQQLSVFTGHFTLEAIEEVCNLDAFPDLDLYEGVEALLEQSLVRRLEDEYGDTQFVLLETIREFAWESLGKAGKTKELQQRHAEFYLNFVEMAAPKLTEKDQVQWLNKIGQKYNNIRTAILWTIEEEATERGLRFGTAMWRYWIVRNRVEGWQRLEQLLGMPEKEELLFLRAKTLSAMGVTLNSIGDFVKARRILKESLVILEKLGDNGEIAICLNHLSSTEWQDCDYPLAREYAESALVLGKRLDHKRTISTSYNNIAWVYNHQSELEKGYEYFNKGAELRKEIGDRRGYAFMRTSLAGVEIRMGKYKSAENKLEEAKQILGVEIRDKQLLAWAITLIGENWLTQKRYKEAKVDLEEALALWRECGNRNVEIRTLISLIDTEIELKEFRLIDQHLSETASLIELYGTPWQIFNFRKIESRLALINEELNEAENLASTLIISYNKIQDIFNIVQVMDLLALIKHKKAQIKQAAHALICARLYRKEKKLVLPIRFVERLSQLEQNLKSQLGEDAFSNLEKKLTSSFDEELKSYIGG